MQFYSQHGKLKMQVAQVHEGMQTSLLIPHVKSKSVHEGDLILGIWIFISYKSLQWTNNELTLFLDWI